MSVLLPNGMMIQEPSSVKLVKVLLDSRGQSERFIVVVKLGDDTEMPVDYCEDEQSAFQLSEQCTDIINGTLDWEEALVSEILPGTEDILAGSRQANHSAQHAVHVSGTKAGDKDVGSASALTSSSSENLNSAVVENEEEDSWDDWGDETSTATTKRGAETSALGSISTEDPEPNHEEPPYIPTPVDEDSDEWPFDNGQDDWY